MFAVPGWSVSEAALKTETEQKQSKPEGAAPNKRKRATKKKEESVTNDNVANLWERVIEGKPARSNKKERSRSKSKSKLQQEPAQPAAKRQKGDSGKPVDVPQPDEDGHDEQPEEDKWDGFSDAELSVVEQDNEVPDSHSDKKAKKEGKKQEKKGKSEQATFSSEGQKPAAAKAKQAKKDKSSQEEGGSPAATTTSSAPAPPTPAGPKLTPLQASMRAKLVSARFRHLNETLYTRPSEEALRLFTESPEMFAEYHEGFRRQVDVWPENPVDGYIQDIKRRAKVRPQFRDSKHRQQQQPTKDDILPLPRTGDTSTIADLGCGDARLASTLTPLSRKLKLSIHSFDLHSPSPHVTRADIANLPLADGAADVAIFCLALMGTNWLDFVEEAYRILRWKGELWIAEIKSRFAGKGGLASSGARVEHSVGNRKRQQAVGKKGKASSAADGAGTEADKEELAVEVDGADDRRGETDLSVFIEALRKRGFVLQGEDMSNKMFVRMLFVKAAPPTKGKGVEAAKAREAAMAARNKKQKRFVWDVTGEDDDKDEAGILKPCVYKLR